MRRTLAAGIRTCLLRWSGALVVYAGAGIIAATANPARAAEPGFVQGLVDQFESSDIVFQRGSSMVPFPPIAFLGARAYGEIEVEGDRGEDLTYDLASVSQAAGLPILLTPKDALVIGEYVSWTDFDIKESAGDSFDVVSLGLPVGWMRQHNESWQLAAFVMPMGHHSSHDNSDWTWQYLGGAFARYVQNNRLWWAFGLYADVAPGEDYYIPYIGGSWSINDHWTLSAILPWPGLLYAPTPDWLFRLGASPSGASWAIDSDGEEAVVNFDAWDFGLSGERHLGNNFWAGAEVGVGGLRGLRFTSSSLEAPDVDIASSWYVGFDLKYRPSLR